jgi:PAS domain S-box-containing protein
MGRSSRIGQQVPGRSYNEQIINSFTSGVVAVDGHGVIVTANPAAAEHLQVDAAELSEGKRFDALPHVRPFIEIMREVRETRQPIQRREILLACPDGVKKEIGVSASRLETRDGSDGVLFLFADMTERRRLERAAELNQQLATIGELTAGVVHELRNPISVIRGMAELLLRKLPNDDDRRKTASLIFDEALHLERSIAQFLGFSRPFELEPAWCKPAEIVERALQLCRAHAQDKKARLREDVPVDLPELRADPGRLAQALANILANAIDASPPEDEVLIRASSTANQIVFEVLDRGAGIHLGPDEDVFQPFFTRKEDGTGLGLAIVHRIVTAHYGTVTHRDREGGGTCFEVRLPLEPGAAW